MRAQLGQQRSVHFDKLVRPEPALERNDLCGRENGGNDFLVSALFGVVHDPSSIGLVSQPPMVGQGARPVEPTPSGRPGASWLPPDPGDDARDQVTDRDVVRTALAADLRALALVMFCSVGFLVLCGFVVCRHGYRRVVNLRFHV